MERLRSPLLDSAFALFVLFLPQTSFSTPCVDYSQYLHVQTTLDLDSISDLALLDDLLFMAAPGSYGSAVSWIEIADVTDPEAPALVEDPIPVPGVIARLEISGNYAYVVGDSGMTVIDVSNPFNFPIVGSMDIPFWGQDISIVGDIAYIANRQGLVVADISNPLQPHILASLPSGSYTQSIAVKEPYAYVGTLGGFFRIVDVSDPQHPVQVGTYSTSIASMKIDGNRLFVGGYGSLLILDLTNPIDPQLLYEVPSSIDYIPGLDVVDDKAYIGNDRLEIFDVSPNAEPVRLGIIAAAGGSILVDGENAFCGSPIGLEVIDVSNPANVPTLSTLEIPFYSPSIAMGSGFVYVGNSDENGQGALHVVGISDPTSPLLLGSLNTPEVLSITLSGSLAILACGGSGVRIASVADPENPVIRGARDTPGYSQHVKVSGLGTHAVIADGGGSIIIMAIANPANPQIVSSISIAGFVEDLDVSGTRAFVVATTGFYILDFSIPSTPDLVAYLPLDPSRPSSVAASGALAFVTSSNDDWLQHTLTVIDCSNPSAPEPVASLPIFVGGYGTRSALVDETLYLFTPDLLSIDVSDPYVPRLVGQSHPPAYASDVAANAEIACVSLCCTSEGSVGGFAIFPAQCGSAAVSAPGFPSSVAATGLASVSPNPFAQSTSISLTLANAGQVRLSIYDVAGRHVRRLFQGPKATGSHRIAWDGRDDSGATVSAGVYLVRLEASGVEHTKRIVRLR